MRTWMVKSDGRTHGVASEPTLALVYDGIDGSAWSLLSCDVKSAFLKGDPFIAREL